MAVAGLVMFAAVAFACTQRVGTFTICKPASKTYASSTCTKITGTTQSGNLGIQLSNGDGDSGGPASEFSAKAINFTTKPYQVTFRLPNSTADCHRVNSGTVVLTATDGTTQFMGPKFFKKFVTPPLGNAEGPARICTQDVPDVVTGQVLNVTVI